MRIISFAYTTGLNLTIPIGRSDAMAISADQFALSGLSYGLFPKRCSGDKHRYRISLSPKMIELEGRNMGDTAAINAFTPAQSNKLLLSGQALSVGFRPKALAPLHVILATPSLDLGAMGVEPSIVLCPDLLVIGLPPIVRRSLRKAWIGLPPVQASLPDKIRIPLSIGRQAGFNPVRVSFPVPARILGQLRTAFLGWKAIVRQSVTSLHYTIISQRRGHMQCA